MSKPKSKYRCPISRVKNSKSKNKVKIPKLKTISRKPKLENLSKKQSKKSI
jgi:hypothetical protein